MNDTGPDGAQARLTIDLGALAANWRLLAARAAPAACAAVVKADAYGIGIAQAVPALARAGCRTFFVAHLTEGVRARSALRAAGWSDTAVRILLLHGLQPGPVIHPDLFAYNLAPVIGSLSELELWATLGNKGGRPTAAIQVDTGMNRIGLPAQMLDAIPAHPLEASGADLLMSHLISAEEPDNPINAEQITTFEAIRARRFPHVAASLANSSGIFLPGRPMFDLVRPGYALYGGNPCPGRENPMSPVVALEADILQTRSIAAGERVGYNGRWIAERASTLATVGVGYADGVPRGARTVGTGDGPVALLGGVACRWVGRVSMDLSIIDVTDVPAEFVRPGAPIQLLGSSIGIDKFGAWCGTIGYEILTSLGRRYSRTYLDSEA